MSICQYTRHATNQIYLHLLQPKVYYSPVLKTVQKLELLLRQLFIPSHWFYTCMINFQDAVWQKSALWFDEGIYRIAKEFQLLNPEKFGNIFLGIEGFHHEEVVLACCEKYLAESSIDSIFVEQKLLVLKLLLRLW